MAVHCNKKSNVTDMRLQKGSATVPNIRISAFRCQACGLIHAAEFTWSKQISNFKCAHLPTEQNVDFTGSFSKLDFLKNLEGGRPTR